MKAPWNEKDAGQPACNESPLRTSGPIPRNHGQGWSQEEFNRLDSEFNSFIHMTAAWHGRTTVAIKAKLARYLQSGKCW
jgi:hypothetical protein